jgi:hypothetical protein
MVEFNWPGDRPLSSDAGWEAIKHQYPVGTEATGLVVALQPFGAFLGFGNAFGLMEMPGFPQAGGPREFDYPDAGTKLSGVVVRHRDTNQQVEIISENAWSDLFRERVAWAKEQAR